MPYCRGSQVYLFPTDLVPAGLAADLQIQSTLEIGACHSKLVQFQDGSKMARTGCKPVSVSL